MSRAQFTPFVSQVSPSFWNTLSALKLNELQLSDDIIHAHAEYTPSKTTRDRVTGSELGSRCRIRLQGDGMRADGAVGDAPVSTAPHAPSMPGLVKNFNTLQEFKAADKQRYFYQVVDDIWAAITGTSQNTLASVNNPNCFLLLTYADLKSYKYYYWFAFPALLTHAPGWSLPRAAPEWHLAQDVLSEAQMIALMAALHEAAGTVACFVSFDAPDDVRLWPLDEGSAYLDHTAPTERLLVFVDPSPHEQYPGWPLRNILTCVQVRLGLTSVRVLCWRDLFEASRAAGAQDPGGLVWKSTLGTLELGDAPSDALVWRGRNTFLNARAHTALPDAVGWERNTQGKLAPKLVSLSAMLDPHYLADRAVDLNLKLMRWRAMPNLALEMIQSVDALLIGAGTLGCDVARTLMGWGIRTITFVDSGRVSYSNPVRQSLYELEDCMDGGRWKAHTAADALHRIFPGVNATGHVLAVPMPGHVVPPASVPATLEAIAELERLVARHDVVFLLTDSREARWLPTLLGAAHNKLVINAALGYDSYVVMRHGVRSPHQHPRLGCYFCNDVVAPADSLSNRTLDQLCTVTRPGLSRIAAGTAVELMVSVLQHPLGAAAPPPRRQPQQRVAAPGEPEPGTTELGSVPQQVRGYLSDFTTLTMFNYAFERCTACSPAVLDAYEQGGHDMILDVCNDSMCLEHISRLDDLKRETDALDLDLDWSDDEAHSEP
ncbi:hypothetical protein CBS9595_003698 [Malassezia furfur]|nr:hypothetical protein CBS9595_003698 [Malassezia furfur]